MHLQGNCAGPPSEEAAKQLNLPDSGVASLQEVRAGQCVVVISKTAFLTTRFNKWFDNLHIAFVSDSLLPGTVTGISASKDLVVQGSATNIFLTRLTFHAMGAFSSAQAFAIPPDQLQTTQALPGFQTKFSNSKHSVLFQGMATSDRQ